MLLLLLLLPSVLAAARCCRRCLLLGARIMSAPLPLCSPHADPNRCDRAFIGNTIGQANAVSDKVGGAGWAVVGVVQPNAAPRRSGAECCLPLANPAPTTPLAAAGAGPAVLQAGGRQPEHHHAERCAWLLGGGLAAVCTAGCEEAEAACRARPPTPHLTHTACRPAALPPAGALLVDTDLSGANLREVVLSKAYAVGANLKGAGQLVAV